VKETRLDAERGRGLGGAFRLATALLLAFALVTLTACSSDVDPPKGSSPFERAGTPGPATVWAIGDAGHAGERERPVARLIERSKPDHLLYLGDVYETGTAEEFEAYDDLYGRLAPITSPTPGNHDWAAHETGYDPYWATQRGREPPSYYSFSLAGWQITSLNSQIYGDDADRQTDWLRREVTGPGDCRLAFWHEPRYSAGTEHGDQPGVDPLWQALRGKAKLVVNAHEHHMERMKPRDGIVEVISGAGGHGFRYPVRKGDDRLAFADDDHDGALRIRLRPGEARLAFVAIDGRVLDSTTVRCRQG